MKPDRTSHGIVELRLEHPGSDAVCRCHAQYYAELAERFEDGFNPGDAAYAGTASGPGDVRTFIAWRDSEAVGCGSLVIGADRTGEVKRMWVSPSARGLGIAWRILASIEDAARAEGLVSLRLDTNRALGEAQAFYRKAGYAGIARYSDNPYAHHWFGKTL